VSCHWQTATTTLNRHYPVSIHCSSPRLSVITPAYGCPRLSVLAHVFYTLLRPDRSYNHCIKHRLNCQLWTSRTRSFTNNRGHAIQVSIQCISPRLSVITPAYGCPRLSVLVHLHYTLLLQQDRPDIILPNTPYTDNCGHQEPGRLPTIADTENMQRQCLFNVLVPICQW